MIIKAVNGRTATAGDQVSCEAFRKTISAAILAGTI
jgi:hypothetical protein